MSDLSEKTHGEVIVDLMFHSLKVNNAVLNAHAAHLLAQLGGEPVSRMVREASRRKNRPSYRLRLLRVIEQVRAVPTADDWLCLTLLATDKNPQIREAAGRCVVHCPATGP